MYRYLHQQNHLCSKNKLILSINGHKHYYLTQKLETEKFFGVMDHTLLQKSRIYSSKKLLLVVDFGRSSTTVLLAELWLTVTASDLENNLATAIPEGTSLGDHQETRPNLE